MGVTGDAPVMDALESAQRIMVDTEGTGKVSQGDAVVDEKATGRRRGHVYKEWNLDKRHVHTKTQKTMGTEEAIEKKEVKPSNRCTTAGLPIMSVPLRRS